MCIKLKSVCITLKIRKLCLSLILFHRQLGQDTIDELRSRDFRRELEERERQAARERAKERGGRSSAVESSKRPRLEQVPTNLDADDPVDDDDEDSEERYYLFDFIFVSQSLQMIQRAFVVPTRYHVPTQFIYKNGNWEI